MLNFRLYFLICLLILCLGEFMRVMPRGDSEGGKEGDQGLLTMFEENDLFQSLLTTELPQILQNKQNCSQVVLQKKYYW